MKVLIITASNRSKQISYNIAMKLSRQIKKIKNTDVEILELCTKQINSCCANALCSQIPEKRCVYQKDDFNMIFEKLITSDAVFFIIPKYAPYPSKFMAFFERVVAISWWGYSQRGKIDDFVLYRKPVGVIGFANAPGIERNRFESLFESFQSIGFNLLSLKDKSHGHGLFINRSEDNENELLKEFATVLVDVI